jgi:MFS family permease
MTPGLGRHRAAVAGAFGTQGLVFVSLTTRLPRFRDRWDLDEVGLSLLLLMIVLLAGIGSVAAEQLARRTSSATLLRGGLLGVAVAVPVAAAAPAFGLFVAGLACYGVALGAVDASTNMQGVALEHRYDRPLLPSLHGAWTTGGVVGAGLALAAGDTPLGLTALIALVPAAAAVAPYLPRERAAPATGADLAPDLAPDLGDDPAAAAGVPWRPILLVGLGMVLFYMVDTAAQTWGPTYLDDVFDTPHRLVALATFPYLLASLVTRVAGDRLVARHGPVRVLRVGTLVGCAALAVVVLAPTWPLAVVGFAALGAGVAVIAPLSFSAAARIAGGERSRVDAVIARFNQFNYAGALLGSVLTGLVGAGSLRVGFAVPMLLLLAMLPLARAFEPAALTPVRTGRSSG